LKVLFVQQHRNDQHRFVLCPDFFVGAHLYICANLVVYFLKSLISKACTQSREELIEEKFKRKKEIMKEA
jgi:predicted ATP-dependent Lon-type protease